MAAEQPPKIREAPSKTVKGKSIAVFNFFKSYTSSLEISVIIISFRTGIIREKIVIY
ncbi:hypothetical protein DCCM_2671 [Desulfocucumis palustris]|uniref:Uncharacterized protein n=1 Tax=Desulfocucumis palustris TaxID=1898651 RepID=A0A2L2XBI0_9FIRM|nr:hypothetical protein DCCM_2671 [Desulfocucumis palustris]